MLPSPTAEQLVLLRAPLADQCPQHAGEQPQDALGPGADAVYQQDSRVMMRVRQGWREPMDKHQGGVVASKELEQRPGIRARLFGLALWALIDSKIGIDLDGLSHQVQEGLQ